MENIISAENVEFHYESESTDGEEKAPPKQVLKGVSLDIKKGEFLAVLGHNVGSEMCIRDRRRKGVCGRL